MWFNRSWVIVERRYDLSLPTNAAYESFSRDVVGRGICNLTAFVQAEQKTCPSIQLYFAFQLSWIFLPANHIAPQI